MQNLTTSSTHSKDIKGGPKINNGSRDPDHALFKGDLSSLCWDLTSPTYAQNLTSLASAVRHSGAGADPRGGHAPPQTMDEKLKLSYRAHILVL